MIPELLESLAYLVKSVHKHKIGSIIVICSAIMSLIVYVAVFKEQELSKVTITNSIAIPVPIANTVDEVLARVADESEADLVAIGVYQYDTIYEEQYVTILRQLTQSSTYPIPNSKFYLSQNDLYTRFLAHKRNRVFIRSFEQTGSKIALSCPLFDNKQVLAGYLTIEYVSTPLNRPIDEIKLLCFKSVKPLEKALHQYFKETRSSVNDS